MKYLLTCKSCNFDNPAQSTKCNSCGNEFSRATSYHVRVVCPDCSRVNMAVNLTCFNCGGSIQPPKNGCYIATACYGSYDAKEVKVFREFRDKALQTNFAGRLFVKSYYSISPMLAEKLKTKPRINLFIRKAVLDNLYVALKEKYSPIALTGLSKTETIEDAAPNNGKCPNCKIGGL
jgi:DnaJ-class molecular chaperone